MSPSDSLERGTLSYLFNIDTTVVYRTPDVVLSDRVQHICQWIIYTVVCQAIDIFGVVTNIINIIVFVKQGFNDAINVSLLGLAISDLCCLVTLIFPNICMAPEFSILDLPFEPVELSYLTGGWPHVTFTRITAWITALCTLERCLCVTIPMKVKSIVTPKRVSVLLVCIFCILIFSISPVYVVNRLAMKFSPRRNKTLIGLVFREDREKVEKISFIINNATIPFCAFLIVIVCTAIMVKKLHESSTWQKKSTNSVQGDNMLIRNQKVSKMVVIISTIFIACFIPISVAFMAMSLITALSVDGKYRNVLATTAGLCLVLESINSSVNIFIYYSMSSKYKCVFHNLFCRTMYADK